MTKTHRPGPDSAESILSNNLSRMESGLPTSQITAAGRTRCFFPLNIIIGNEVGVSGA